MAMNDRSHFVPPSCLALGRGGALPIVQRREGKGVLPLAISPNVGLIWFDVIIYPGLQKSKGVFIKLRN